jgi:hypothetical protein
MKNALILFCLLTIGFAGICQSPKGWPEWVGPSSSWETYIQINENGYPKFGYVNKDGNVVIEAFFGAAEKFKDGYAVVSFQENKGPNRALEYGILFEEGLGYDSLVFRDFRNLGHGFIKAQKIALSDKTSQMSHSAGRVNFSGVWGLFYKAELILPELYQHIEINNDRVTFQSNFSEEQLDGNPKSGYITFDGVIH